MQSNPRLLAGAIIILAAVYAPAPEQTRHVATPAANDSIESAAPAAPVVLAQYIRRRCC